MFETLLHWLTGLGNFSYLAVFALVFAESGLLLLLPGETVVLVAGVLASRGVLMLPVLMAVASVSAILGDATGYGLGRGPARRRFAARGRFLFLRQREVDQVREMISHHGGLAIVASRFIGVLRVATPFVCGLTDLPPERFFPYNLPACVVWGITIAALGDLGGNAWERTHGWVGRVSLGLGLLALIGGIVWIKRRRDREA